MSDTNQKKKKRFHYCFVPDCKSTSISTPNKSFFCVPKNQLRKKWLSVCRREQSGSPTTVFFCCEDHFDLEKDTSNMTQHHIMGTRLKLKKGVLPTRFDCQVDRKPTHTAPDRAVLIKKRKSEVLASCLIDMEELEEPVLEAEGLGDIMSDNNKGVQTQISRRSKASQTTHVKMQDAAVQCNLIVERSMVESEDSEGESSDSEYEIDSLEDSEDSEYLEENTVKSNIEYFITRNPKQYIGVPKKQMHLLEMWAEKYKKKLRNIFLSLMKIKTNDSFLRIADSFGISKQRAGRIFLEVLPMLESILIDLIFMPKILNKISLPLAFRSNYYNVSCVIDCFEVEIEKPSDPIKQSLTWSEYKKANTLKYLVSCSPNGCVNFVSEGYGGRTTDKVIVESCGFIDAVPHGTQVMADRGFKHIEHLLVKNNCLLVRPPSLKEGTQFLAEEVREGKRIASLRIHVERLISRFREYAMLKPHACIDHYLIGHLDTIVNICAGLINLQEDLIKL